MQRLPAIILAVGLACLFVGLDPDRGPELVEHDPGSAGLLVLIFGALGIALGGAQLLRRRP